MNIHSVLHIYASILYAPGPPQRCDYVRVNYNVSGGQRNRKQPTLQRQRQVISEVKDSRVIHERFNLSFKILLLARTLTLI